MTCLPCVVFYKKITALYSHERNNVMYKLSPSKAHRYLKCTASLMHDVEFTETPITIRGTLLHKMAEHLIKGENDIFMKLVETEKINDYEQRLVETYVDFGIDTFRKNNCHTIRVEERGTVILFGHKINMVIDLFMMNDETAYVIDLKTGNTEVDVVDNEQLIIYALYVIIAYPSIKNIVVSIYQKMKPKIYVMTRSYVQDYLISKEKTFNEITKDQLTYTPSDVACKFCAIRDTCKARAEWISRGKV